jgi:hypothetical protein
MVIDKGIADGIAFFPMDALSSAVAMKITCDVQLTLMASSLYRLLGARLAGAMRSPRDAISFAILWMPSA